MPIYEYLCHHCHYQLEDVQKFSDPPLTLCPECNEHQLFRKPSVSAFHLKGGGWYKDGYHGQNNQSPEAKNDKSPPSPKTTPSSSDSKPTKTESSSSATSNAA